MRFIKNGDNSAFETAQAYREVCNMIGHTTTVEYQFSSYDARYPSRDSEGGYKYDERTFPKHTVSMSMTRNNAVQFKLNGDVISAKKLQVFFDQHQVKLTEWEAA